MKPLPAIVLAPLISHPIWAVLMFISPQPLHTIGIDAIYRVMPNAVSAALLMFVASALAWMSHRESWHGNWRGFLCILPQQFLMLLSAWTIFIAVATGVYANNYRPPEGSYFIGADQVFFFVCCVLHTVCVWRTYALKSL